MRNDFQEAMEKVDQAYLDEILKSTEHGDSSSSNDDDKMIEKQITFEEIMEEAKKPNRNIKDDMELIRLFIEVTFKNILKLCIYAPIL